MYDQVIPAVRDTLRKIPDLTESEGTDAQKHARWINLLNYLGRFNVMFKFHYNCLHLNTPTQT